MAKLSQVNLSEHGIAQPISCIAGDNVHYKQGAEVTAKYTHILSFTCRSSANFVSAAQKHIQTDTQRS